MLASIVSCMQVSDCSGLQDGSLNTQTLLGSMQALLEMKNGYLCLNETSIITKEKGLQQPDNLWTLPLETRHDDIV
jgi:hypothetical protein